jgi:hypothetical protein
MKSYKDYILEAPDDDVAPNKKAIVNMIAANLFRFANNPDVENTRGLLLLIAALSVLNTGDDPQSINTARRLASGAIIARTRKAS